jgi:hypothetical protein
MADKKISALTGASTPLAGTEVLPIVQGGDTVKVSVANLTAGRAISATELTLSTGNLVVSNGKGINFTANTPAAGMTSQLLNDYEEGTWTPVDGSGAGLVLTVASASYTKVGRLVEASFAITFPATVDVLTCRLGGLPFTAKTFGASMNTVSFSVVQYAAPITGVVDANATTLTPLTYGAGTLTNANMSGLILRGTAIYEV